MPGLRQQPAVSHRLHVVRIARLGARRAEDRDAVADVGQVVEAPDELAHDPEHAPRVRLHEQLLRPLRRRALQQLLVFGRQLLVVHLAVRSRWSRGQSLDGGAVVVRRRCRSTVRPGHARAGVGDDARLRQPADVAGRIVARQHDDGGARPRAARATLGRSPAARASSSGPRPAPSCAGGSPRARAPRSARGRRAGRRPASSRGVPASSRRASSWSSSARVEAELVAVREPPARPRARAPPSSSGRAYMNAMPVPPSSHLRPPLQ